MAGRKVYIRADASPAIGYGHFVRSCALAAMLREDFDVTLFTAEPNDFQQGETAGVCRLVALPHHPALNSHDIAFDPVNDPFAGMLDGSEIVVLDNYFFDDSYIRSIQSRGCPVVLLQDFFGVPSPADALLSPCRNPHYALLRSPFLPEEFAQNASHSRLCKVASPEAGELEGVRPLNNDSAHLRSKWVVAIGGTDPLGLTGKFVRELEAKGKTVITLGGGKTAKEVAEIFRVAEGVVCSASSVCYEAMSCGCKVAAGWYVDNQKDFYNLLCQRGLIMPLGDLREARLPENIEDAPQDARISEAFHSAPKNIRALFHALSLQKVNYTELTPEQSHRVWEVRVRPDICKYMTNPEPFSFEQHTSFIESLRTRSDRRYWAFFLDGEFVGSFDYVDIIPGVSAERGLYVNPDYQGRGIARQMEALMDCTEAPRLGLTTISAEVLSTNERSLNFHRQTGYSESCTTASDSRLCKEMTNLIKTL